VDSNIISYDAEMDLLRMQVQCWYQPARRKMVWVLQKRRLLPNEYNQLVVHKLLQNLEARFMVTWKWKAFSAPSRKCDYLKAGRK
jgi:hypothetical protein